MSRPCKTCRNSPAAEVSDSVFGLCDTVEEEYFQTDPTDDLNIQNMCPKCI